MFNTNIENLRNRKDHFEHQEQGGKELLHLLVKPFISETPHFDSIRGVLEATAAGRLTPAQAEKAIEDVRMQQNLCTLAAPVMLAADVLQNYCSNLSKGCEHCEQELKTLTNKLNEAFANLEKALKVRC